ncbi:hypothetical protein OJF2_51440 [Aquisphaera giovannonii]|uniref:Uncharacterized protein n=1 Tax=Aquisphaera giovannonii TaxID=406548 RepID=A0A5B9W9P5_9BACT|nr:hypothetical protein [Aquisphaera giovannonii]QEH36560.1 hypothetical protein OJF2_51440 [Aquisphaera giovannonii]
MTARHRPKAARELNRSPGEVVKVLAVPLIDARQMHYLRAIAEEGNLGQTPEEVAAFFITEGISRRILTPGGSIEPPESWEGFQP